MSPVSPGCAISWPSPAGFECCSVGSCGVVWSLLMSVLVWSRCSSGVRPPAPSPAAPGDGLAVRIPCAVGCMPGPRYRGPMTRRERPTTLGGEPGACPESTPAGRRTRSDVVQRVAGRDRAGPASGPATRCPPRWTCARPSAPAARACGRRSGRCARSTWSRCGTGTAPTSGRMSMDPLVQSVAFRGRLDRDDGSGCAGRWSRSASGSTSRPPRRCSPCPTTPSAAVLLGAPRRAGPADARPRRARRPAGRRSTGPSTCCWPSRCQRAAERADRRLRRRRRRPWPRRATPALLPCRPHPRRDRRGGRGRRRRAAAAAVAAHYAPAAGGPAAASSRLAERSGRAGAGGHDEVAEPGRGR